MNPPLNIYPLYVFSGGVYKVFVEVLRQVCLGRLTALVLLQNLMPQFLTIKGHQLALLI